MRYDLHIHTHYSKCSNLKPDVILKTAKEKGLNGIAITDHNSIKGALEVAKLNKDKNFEVIIGEEIKTLQGEVLGLYLKQEIITDNLEDAINQIKKQGGLAILAHPFAYIRQSFRGDIEKLKNKLDGIECFNSRTLYPWLDKRANKLAETHNLAKTGSSDAHFWFEIGAGYTEFKGSLKQALKNKNTFISGTYKYSIPGAILTFFEKRVIRNVFRKY